MTHGNGARRAGVGWWPALLWAAPGAAAYQAALMRFWPVAPCALILLGSVLLVALTALAAQRRSLPRGVVDLLRLLAGRPVTLALYAVLTFILRDVWAAHGYLVAPLVHAAGPAAGCCACGGGALARPAAPSAQAPRRRVDLLVPAGAGAGDAPRGAGLFNLESVNPFDWMLSPLTRWRWHYRFYPTSTPP